MASTINGSGVSTNQFTSLTGSQLTSLSGPVESPADIEADLRKLFSARRITPPQVFSDRSQFFFHDTFFNDFGLQVIPCYNFWTRDETTNDKETRGDRQLSDVPRFIRLAWQPAPDLAGNNLHSVKSTPPTTSSFTVGVNSGWKPVKFASENHNHDLVSAHGISFSLAPFEDFTLARSNLSDGYVSPGVLKTVSELRLGQIGLNPSVTPVEISNMATVDEDAFLVNPDTQGISIYEFQSNLSAIGSSTGDVSSDEISKSAQNLRTSFFNDKFLVQFSPENGGLMHMQGIDPSFPPVSLTARTALISIDEGTEPVLQLAEAVSAPDSALPSDDSMFVRGSFVDPSVAGVLSDNRLGFVSRPEHAENVIALSNLMPALELLSQSTLYNDRSSVNVVSLACPPQMDGLEYVGYVIEKYSPNAAGVFQLVEEIDIPRRDYTEYVDCKVVYGQVYRYRIKAVVRWTRDSLIGVHGIDQSSTSAPGKNSLDPILSSVSTFFSTEWNNGWAYGIVLNTFPPSYPDEFTVRPVSMKKLVVVSAKLPDDSLKDLLAMRIYKKVQDQFGNDLTEWRQIGKDFAAGNVIYFDQDVDFYQNGGNRYVYSSQMVSKHDEVSTLSEQYSVRLNNDYPVTGEFPIEFVSQAGIKFEHMGAFSVYPYRRFRTELIAQDGKFNLSGRNKVGRALMNDASYVLRVESLDTGEIRDTVGIVSYDLRPAQVNTIAVDSALTLHSQGIQLQNTQAAKKSGVGTNRVTGGGIGPSVSQADKNIDLAPNVLKNKASPTK